MQIDELMHESLAESDRCLAMLKAQQAELINQEIIHEAPQGAPDTHIETYRTSTGKVVEHAYSVSIGKNGTEAHGDTLRELNTKKAKRKNTRSHVL